MSNKFLILTIPLFLVSCAPTYKAKNIKDSAEISINRSTSVSSAFICSGDSLYSAPSLTGAEGKPIIVDSGNELTMRLGITFESGSSMLQLKNSCFTNFTFVPELKGKYEMEFDYSYDEVKRRPEFEKGCHIKVLKIIGSEKVEIKSSQNHNQKCSDK